MFNQEQVNMPEEKPEVLHIQVPDMRFEGRGVNWHQEGNTLIGVSPEGYKLGLYINPGYRMVGVDENARPVLKRVDT
jgi:hypothetical protein